MVSIQHIEESLSISYVNAIVANSGQSFDVRNRDYGVDGSVIRIQRIKDQYIDMGPAFDCQLKATIDWSIDQESESINYDMKVEAYNRLIRRNENSTLPCFLILYCLPKNRDEWVNLSEEELILKKCCYFYYLNGAETDNTSQKRIKIPIKNIFNSDAVKQLITDPFVEAI